jgi:hypothetical protein
MYNILIAAASFNCPACGVLVVKGDACMQDEAGRRFCFCQLPKRNLRPKIRQPK